MTRNILYVTGSRADYGLMRSTLKHLDERNGVELAICVTGSHLDADSGFTVSTIEDDGLKIAGRIDVGGHQESGAQMGVAFARVSEGFSDVIQATRPDIVLLLGDRYEMLAAASVTVMQNIALAHVHGGERSGTVDELFRHAISKLSHIHLVATEASRQRLIKMGEMSDQVYVVGAPGLDEIRIDKLPTKSDVVARFSLSGSEDGKYAVVLFHPVVQELDAVEQQVESVIQATATAFDSVLVLNANTDPGGMRINDYIAKNAPPGFVARAHIDRQDYLSAVAHADVLIGNSSSGIIEAASLGTWTLNVGSRQRLRETNHNVVNADPTYESVVAALTDIRGRGAIDGKNVYGDGQSGPRIGKVLSSISLGPALLAKQNAY